MSFISELKRRNVLRAAFAYAVVWWLLVQVAGLLLDAFNAPDWIFSSFIILLAIGFPVAVILSWFFELTTDGLVRSAGPGTARSRTYCIQTLSESYYYQHVKCRSDFIYPRQDRSD